jgi:hypothetical protein
VNCRSCTASATFFLAACLRVLGWLDPRRALLVLTVGWLPKHVRDPGWSPTHTCSHATARTRGLTTAVLQRSCAFKILRSSLCTIDHASFRLEPLSARLAGSAGSLSILDLPHADGTVVEVSRYRVIRRTGKGRDPESGGLTARAGAPSWWVTAIA